MAIKVKTQILSSFTTALAPQQPPLLSFQEYIQTSLAIFNSPPAMEASCHRLLLYS